MNRYLFLGDTHGDLDFVERACEFGRRHSVSRIIQVGDWGFIWPGNDRAYQLSDLLARHHMPMTFIDGNHDHHPALQLGVRAGVNPRDHWEMTPHLRYQARGSTWEDEDGTRFLFVGGAPSIDKASRVRGRSWWPEELITADDIMRAMAAKPPIHVLVTHDAPRMPPQFESRGDANHRINSERSMEALAAIRAVHRPVLHVHGHWHHRYMAKDEIGVVLGLDCNWNPENAMCVWQAEER